MRSKEMTRLYERSGEVESNNPVASLFYDILRDGYMAPGDLHRLVNSARVQPANYTNGYLASYAIYLSELLNDVVGTKEQLNDDTISRDDPPKRQPFSYDLREGDTDPTTGSGTATNEKVTRPLLPRVMLFNEKDPNDRGTELPRVPGPYSGT